MNNLGSFKATYEDYTAISPNGILIVIVSYNACHLMQENIRSIRQTVPEGCYKILVVDNASEDGVAEWLEQQDDIILVQNHENVGFGPANNQGADAVRGTEYENWDIMLLNNDTRLAENSLFCLKQALYSAEDVGAVGSVSNYAGNKQEIWKEFETVDEYLEFGRTNNRPFDPCENTPYEERVRLTGFALLIRRSVWDKAGGFDPDFAPGYIEDDALSMEILKAGYRLLVVNNSFIYHAGSQSFVKTSNYKQLYQDHVKLFNQKYGFDILDYSYADEALLYQLPYKQEDTFSVLQIGCGLGADLKAIHTWYPRCRTVGVETQKVLYDIACHTEEVYPSVEELATHFPKFCFDVLLIDQQALELLSQEERSTIAGCCRGGAVLLSKDPRYQNFPFEKIKQIIWSSDDVFDQNAALVREMEDHGIVSSILSESESDMAEKMVLTGLDQENVLFIDANPGIIPYLTAYYKKQPKSDTAHETLRQYRILEEKIAARRNSSSFEQFLYDCDIHVTINRNCMEEIERISELVARTDRLNYTQNRDRRDELIKLLTDDWNDAGYIRVRDRFGDYGISGFFCYNTREKQMKHFLFSDKVFGMGVEQFVYDKLGCPTFIAERSVASLEKGKSIPWITEDFGKEILRDKLKEKRVRVLLKGQYDMSALEPYLSGGNITKEFDYANEDGFVTMGQSHTMHIYESGEMSKKELDAIIQDVPFITQGDFVTKLFSERYHVICLSLLQDMNAGVYRNRGTGAYVSFGSCKYPLTDPESQKLLIQKEIQDQGFEFTQEILDRFSSGWDYIGNTPLEFLFRNLDYIYEHVPGNPLIILLLGSEIDCERENKEFAGLAEVYREVNPIIRQFAEDHERIRIIDPTEFIHSQDDFEDCVNHYSGRVYYEIAGRICEYINEAARRSIW